MAEHFEKFSGHSGLWVNVNKSRAYFSKGVPKGKMDWITSTSSIRSCTSLEKYMGFFYF